MMMDVGWEQSPTTPPCPCAATGYAPGLLRTHTQGGFGHTSEQGLGLTEALHRMTVGPR